MLRMSVSARALLATVTVWLPGWSLEAFSQSSPSPPPVRELVDGNGVDLLTGMFGVSQVDIDIGPPESRLAFARSARAELYGQSTSFRASTDVMLRFVAADQAPDGVAYVAVIDGLSADRFTQSGTTFTSQAGMGSTLAFDSSSQTYVYTQRDGTVIRFPAPRPSDAWDGIRAGSIEAPDGTRTEFSNKHWALPGYPFGEGRVQSVVNNAGYQLKLEYAGPQSTTLTRVSVLNRGSAYCDPAADTCAAAASAPSVRYAWGLGGAPGFAQQLTVTDAGGRQTRWIMGAGAQIGYGDYTGGGPSAVKSAASSTSDTLATNVLQFVWGVGQSVMVSRVVRHGRAWDYELVQKAGVWPILRITNPLGHVREVQWNQAVSQVHSDRDEMGRAITYQYDSLGRRTRVTYPEGNYVQVTYDSRGNVTQTRRVAKPGSGLPDVVISAVYPAVCTNPKTCNKPTSTTDALGAVTEYTYDPVHGGVLTVTAPAPSPGAVRPQTRYTYAPLYAWYRNSAGALVQAPTPIYKLTQISSCRTLSSCAGTADEVRTTLGYQVGSASTPSNLLLTSITQSAGNGAVIATTTMTYDARGNRVTVDGPLPGSADTIITRYDVLRRVVGVVGPDPDGAGALKRRAARFTFRADDQLALIERGTVNGLSDADFAGMAVLEQMHSGYDDAGRKTSEALVSGGSIVALTHFGYDALGRLECTALRMNPGTFGSLSGASACSPAPAGVFGPDRIVRRFYNAAGQLTKVQTGVGTASQRDEQAFTYTGNSQLLTHADARGNLTTFQYDGQDRLYRTYFPSRVQAGVSSGADFEQLSYDMAGNMVQKILRDGQAIGFGYDALGRVRTKNLPGPEADVVYGYDNLGHTTSISTAGQTLTFGYDALGRLRTQTGPHGTIVSDYDAAGRRTRITWPDAFHVTYDYLVTGEMSAVRENGAGSGPGVLARYTYDDLGRRVALTRGNGTVTAYDYSASRLQQLTQNLAGTSGDLTAAFTYNPAGQIANRTLSNDAYVWTQDTNLTRSYTPNGLNQYAAIDSAAVSHDARGNITSLGAGAAYSYSSENLLVGAPGVALRYGPAGRLHEISTPTATTRFAYDGASLVAEYNDAHQLLRRYVHGAAEDEPLVWYEGSGTSTPRWLHADERGSIVALSDALGLQVAVNRYDEFGTPAVSNAGRFQYTGQVWMQELGLYHFKARAYSASLGRFMQPDPIGYTAGINLYTYVRGDPLNFRDPTGLEGVTVTGTRPCYQCVSALQFSQLWGVSQEYVDRVLESIRNSLAGVQASAEQASQCYPLDGYTSSDVKAWMGRKPMVEQILDGPMTYVDGVAWGLAAISSQAGAFGPVPQAQATEAHHALGTAAGLVAHHPAQGLSVFWGYVRARPWQFASRLATGGTVSFSFSPYVGIPVSGFAVYGNAFKGMHLGNRHAPMNDLLHSVVTGEAQCK
jgi:RHS repeat-associated protein